MQARRMPISTTVFLIAIALLILVVLVVSNPPLLASLLLAIIFIVLFLLLISLLLLKEFHSKNYKLISFFSEFRHFFLQAFRRIGWTCRWLSSGWRSHAVMLADAVLIYIIIKYIEASLLQKLPLDSLSIILFDWGPILAIWFLLEVAGILSKASNQLVIDEVDLSADSKQEGKKGGGSDKGGKIETNGLADLLAVNINRISELYRVVDEQRAIKSESGAGRPIEATLKSVDMSEFLMNSSSEKSQISFGPISIPIGSVTGLVGRLMQGPRITVALHKSIDAKDKEYYYLTATMSGKEPYSWIVEDQKPLEGEQETRSIDDMATELSHRIFAKMIFGEQGKLVAWRAVWNFNEGLRAYRDCLLSIKKRQSYLKDAEKHFIETVEEDNRFDQAYYNLGVIYTELNQLDSAESAFSRAIEKKPDKWEPYYALGINLYNRAKDQEELAKSYIKELPEPCKLDIKRQYEMVIKLCGHIIDLMNKKGNLWNRDFAVLAKAYDLMGNAQSHLSIIKCKHCSLISRDDNTNNENSGIPLENNLNEIELDIAIENCERSVHYSWLNLYKAEFGGDQIESANKIVSECLIDLAELYLYKEKYKKDLHSDNYASNAVKALEQACHLQSADPNLYFSLGRAYFWIGKLKDAKGVFESGVRMSPQDPRFSAYLGYTKFKKGDKNILESWERVVLYGPGACSEALDIMEEACKNLIGIDSYQSMRINYASFLAKLSEDEKKGETIMNCLREMIEHGEKKNGGEWKYAIALIKLLDLSDDLEAWDCKQLEMENLFKKIEDLIERFSALKGKKRGYEEAYNRYALGYLLFLYYHYKKDLFEDIEKVSKAEKEKFEKECQACKNEAEANLTFAEILLKSKIDDLYTTKNCSLPGYNAYIEDYCQILVDSGQLYLKYKEYKKAERHFEYAIETLKGRPEEIKRRGLYSLLAKSIRLQNKSHSRALKLAQRGRILNPLGYEERKELGNVFCDLKEFDYGLEELDNAHSWNPDNPDILFELGKNHLKRALICNDKKLRKKILNNAMENIKQALKTIEKSQVEKRGRVRYWLGRVYSELNENKKAIPHFRILFKVRFDKGKIDDVWLIAALQLGYALFKIKSYNEADSIFDQIIKRLESVENSSADVEICDIIGERLEDRFSRCEILIRACLGKSFSSIERRGDLSEALHYAKLADDYIGLCKGLIAKIQCEEDQVILHEKIRPYQASCEDCRGWILFNLGQVDNAISYLEKSVSEWADSLAYMHLALAYESKLESRDHTTADNTVLATKTLECYRLAKDLDIRDEYADELTILKQRLAKKNIEISPKEEEKNGLPEPTGSEERCSQG